MSRKPVLQEMIKRNDTRWKSRSVRRNKSSRKYKYEAKYKRHLSFS